MQKMKIDLIKITTINILLFAPLSVYPILGAGVTLGDVLLLINFLLIVFLPFKGKKVFIPIPIFIYIIMIILVTLIHWSLGIEVISNDLLSFLRYIFYLCFCLYVSKNFFDFKYFYQIYKVVAFLLAIYVIFQFVSFFLFKFILPINILSFIGLRAVDSVYWYDTLSRYTSGLIQYRPCAIFIEPAHYVVYQAPILYLLLNNIVNDNRNNIYLSFIIIISILLSGSTTGIIIISFCVFNSILRYIKKDIIKSVIVCLFVLIGGFLFFNSNYGLMVIQRTFSDENTGAINGRFANTNIVFSDTNKHIIIGNGMAYAKDNYVPSYHRLILSYGLIGFITFIMFMLLIYDKCNIIGKRMIILFMLTMIGTLSLFGIATIMFFTIILSNYKVNNDISFKRMENL